jgi:hypothetical protein
MKFDLFCLHYYDKICVYSNNSAGGLIVEASERARLMRKLSAPVAITMLLAIQTTPFADSGSRRSDRGAARSRHSLAHKHLGAMRPERAIAFSSQLVPHSVDEREGLSRNPEDCVV